jgi:hypothetical protein
VTSCQKSNTNECKANCPWIVHCLARDDGNPMSVRFCGSCDKIRTIDSMSRFIPPAGLAAEAVRDVLCKVYLISDVEVDTSGTSGFTPWQRAQLKRLAQAAKEACSKATMIALDFTCEDCLSVSLRDLPSNKIHAAIKEAYKTACVPPDLLPKPEEKHEISKTARSFRACSKIR